MHRHQPVKPTDSRQPASSRLRGIVQSRMWKWILGILAIIIALVVWRAVAAYKSFTAGGNQTSIVIAAPPVRVFASLANADSLSTYLVESGAATTTRTGPLQVGDKIHVESRSTRGSRTTSFDWTVLQIRPAELLVMEIASDSVRGALAVRRDSLSVRGDSTVVTSTVSAPMFDSLQTVRRDSGRAVRGAMVGFGSKLFISAFRLQAEAELRRLKSRIESK